MSILDKCLNGEKKVRAQKNVIDRKAKEFLVKQGIPFNDYDALNDAKRQVTVTDEEVMEEYKGLAGLVEGDPSTQRPTPSQIEEGKKEREKMEKEEKRHARKTRVKTIKK